MKNIKLPSALTVFIHKYGMYYTVLLLLFILVYYKIYPNSLSFWVFWLALTMHTYFVFVHGSTRGFSLAMRHMVIEAMIKEIESTEKNKNKTDEEAVEISGEMFERMKEIIEKNKEE